MDFLNSIKNIGAGFFMLVALAGIVATSKGKRHYNDAFLKPGPVDGSYKAKITSQCTETQIKNVEIEVQNYQIKKPEDQTFMDFGFPDEIVDGVSVVSGVIYGENRYCDPVLGGAQKPAVWDYSCTNRQGEPCFIRVRFVESYPPRTSNSVGLPRGPVSPIDPSR